MESGVEKVDSGAGGSQHRRVGRPRQLRACVGLVLVAVLAAAPLPLAAQQEQRVVRGLSFDGNKAIDDYTLSTAIATSNSSFFASVWWLRWIGLLGEKRYFNELEFRRDVVRLLLLYRQSGYMNALIDTLVRRGGHDGVIRVGDVAIAGIERVDTGTVRRMLSVRRNDLFRQDRLYQTQRDLYGTGLFRSVNVVLADTAPPPDPGDSTVRVLVRLREGPRHRVRLGVGYGTVDCFRVQSGWTSFDFLGGARTLDLTGRLSKLGVGVPTDWSLRDNVCRALRDDLTSDTLNYGVGLTLRQPFFLSPQHAASFGMFPERRSEFKAYTRQAGGGNLAVTLNARRNIPVTVGYGFSYVRTTAQPAVFCSVFRVCDAGDRALLESSRRFAAVTVSGVRDQVNNVLDPSGGSLVTVTVMHASRLVYSDTLYEFNRRELEASRYYPLGRRGVFAWRVRAGAIVLGRITLAGQSVHFVPPDQRFYGGGPNSVRGYARNELGPRVYVTDSVDVNGSGDSTFLHVTASPTGGNTIFVANTEVRFATPLFPDRMRVALFVDAGQVWERGEPLTTVNGLRVTPGVGLRFATPLGPVRLDAAYNGYPSEPGPVYLLNNTDKSLTLIQGVAFRPALPPGFWRRIVWQFAVGQAF